MRFLIAAGTDVGTVKKTNQDSLSVLQLETPLGEMAFGVLCDGMGGLEHGELASAAVVRAFRRWALEELPELCREPLQETQVEGQWQDLLEDLNRRIKACGQRLGSTMGTTAVALLLTQDRYYLINVGDSRGYELTDHIHQMSRDHSLVAREVEAGRITPEEAEHHPKRNVLTLCVGASQKVRGDLYSGRVKKNAVYLLCSDGFRHELKEEELFRQLGPQAVADEAGMEAAISALIAENKLRGEEDNISAVLLRTL